MEEKPRIDYEELKRGGIVKLKEKEMFSIWVKTSCCNLNSRQLRKLADITEKYARGFLLFTTRQTPHIPFVNLNDMGEVKKELSQVYLELDRCGARVRNINVCYNRNICPEAAVDCISLAERLDNFFYDPIPYKIKIGVSGCKKDCVVSRVLTDIGFVGVNGDGRHGYDVYVGGRLGLNPHVGVKMAGLLSENECVKFVWNYFNLLRKKGREGERGADLIKRIGADKMRQELNRSLQKELLLKPVKCETRLRENETNRGILRIKATCGEVDSEELRKIADIAERYGLGFVHFSVRGCPEIPCTDREHLEEARRELRRAGLQVLDEGIDNLQTCYGGYCTEANMDTQSLLRKIEKGMEDLGGSGLNIKISASGCPNSCGIAHLSDMGFMGVAEPEIDSAQCNGCGICLSVCRKEAIRMENKTAVVDDEKCSHCGQCIAACPFDAVSVKKRGFTVLVGGKEGENPRLGEVMAEFLSEQEAVQIALRFLRLAKEIKVNLAIVKDNVGRKKLKEMLFPVEEQTSVS